MDDLSIWRSIVGRSDFHDYDMLDAKLHRKRKKFEKVLRTVTKAKSYLHWQYIGFWKILWRTVHGITVRQQSELSGAGGRARLVVLAATVGGRWSQETAQFLRGLAHFRSEGTPELLRERVKLAWLRRWQNLLACSAAKALALSLLDRRPTVGAGSTPPTVDEVVREGPLHVAAGEFFLLTVCAVLWHVILLLEKKAPFRVMRHCCTIGTKS